MGAKQIFAILVGGLAITSLNLWAVERDSKLFNTHFEHKGVVWR